MPTTKHFVKCRIDPRKLGKAPVSVLPLLFAHFEYDSSFPCFDAIRPYLAPSTVEEKWSELFSCVRMKYKKLGFEIERRFCDESAKPNRRFGQINSYYQKVNLHFL